jgi:aldose 1-epimerase
MKLLTVAAYLFSGALAQMSMGSNGTAGSGPDKDGKFLIEAEGIRANFIPYGASVSNLWIKDKHGIERDIVLGFDNASYYTIDASHPHLGGVPGRYANRIKNSTFDIDGQTFHVLPNENNNNDTLHGGPDGWDFVRSLRT